MAGKTKINGTAYTIKGGKTKVNGTSYSIGGGYTKIGGTAKKISFMNGRVPVGFQECEYVQASSNAYILTTVSKTTDDTLTVVGKIMSPSVWGSTNNLTTLIGTENSVLATVGYANAENDNFFFESNGKAWFYYPNYSTWFTATLSSNSVSVSGLTHWFDNNISSFYPFGKLYIFNGVYGGSTVCTNGDKAIKSVRMVSSSNVEKINLVPCYCTTTVTGYKGSSAVSCASGTIGLYDIANSRFYVNSGSGTFTKGADV